MTVEPIRFLALAFATADLLFEVDAGGAVTFTAGASMRLAGQSGEALAGSAWARLLAEPDRALGESLVAGVEEGERRGPVAVRLAFEADGGPRFAALSVFRLPGNGGRVSCALTATDPPAAGARPDGALHDRAGFETAAQVAIEAAQAGGVELELALIELQGLARRKGELAGPEAEALARRVAGALRAEALADAAADLGGERFAILHRRGEPPEVLARRLVRVLGAWLEPRARTLAVDPAADPTRMMRALRFAVDSFVAGDGETAGATSLSEVVDLSLRQTMAKAGAFETLVQARRFELMFQPVVALSDLSVRHHEVLVRFDRDRSPFAMIRMAEELDIIESLDRAVADEAVKRLRADRTRTLRLAVNVSGRTIVSPGFLEMISRLAAGGDLADRLMFEVTESAVIDDLALAQKHVQALQAMRFHVCLDDFGAGAASFAYLQQLSVDVVKIDGAYVRELVSSGRDDAMIRHLVGLCRELRVATVAEMVETREVADALRRAGVDYAQGWLFGQPSREPVTAIAGSPRAAARRMGAVEQWG
ncbi:MAG: EAL domain-containing protein [Caulobacteraceae bacterium]|nr:EAL domain-containing protein [Caulobacteraceae bacterium]